MPRRTLVFAIALVVLAGCTGSVANPSPTDSNAATAETARSPNTAARTPEQTPATRSLPNETAGERAIAAEKARVRNATADWAGRTDLSFGILRPAEYEVRGRNASGVLVDVTVGYSVSFACGLSADGATTEARYLVTAERVRLVTVQQDVGESPGAGCGESSPTPNRLQRPL